MLGTVQRGGEPAPAYACMCMFSRLLSFRLCSHEKSKSTTRENYTEHKHGARAINAVGGGWVRWCDCGLKRRDIAALSQK